MRLLHVADLHLDRNFEGISEFPAVIQAEITTANQAVYENIITTAIAEKVDVVIFAGDNFHQPQISLKMQRLFVEGLEKLVAHEIVPVVVFGNHDYFEVGKFWFNFPEKALVFTEETVKSATVTLANGETVCFSGFSYCKPKITERKALEFPLRQNTTYHIGIYHGEVGINHFAPFQVAELQEKAYDYWALGHIHKGDALYERAYYSGTPQGHNRKETAGTGVLLVELAGGAIDVQHLEVATVVWQQQVISLEKCQRVQEVVDFLVQKIQVNDESLRLLELKLTDIAHLGADFLMKLQNQELLMLVQAQLLQESNQRVFLYRLVLAEESLQTSKLLIPQELLEQGIGNYRNQQIFQEVMQDLLIQPVFTQLFMQKEFQEQVLAATKERLSQL
ncbi:exonuclease SbcD [Enterococcus sp. PF1-24]|uniref:metallophosphoesterase family protein n=1 Tax=unclassified Enterococcus TaxID=2608891 RepID=UPI0024748CC8|nr:MULTISPECIES: DNA repair exonuclease [unclassified Enterococcus]MDH6363515.1 exonuclease SbcD [Enterococcus sp. PFB1-1]MDH6400609.1 exonuclease SbcD [Enterococcus sp. PF1-24]